LTIWRQYGIVLSAESTKTHSFRLLFGDFAHRDGKFQAKFRQPQAAENLEIY